MASQCRLQAMTEEHPEYKVQLQELECVFRDVKEYLIEHLLRQRWPHLTDAELKDTGGPPAFDRRLEVFLELGKQAEAEE
jgi:hypothetical protein